MARRIPKNRKSLRKNRITKPPIDTTQVLTASVDNPERERVTLPEIPSARALASHTEMNALDEAFFSSETTEDSFPPMIEDEPREIEQLPPSPAVLARRRRYRRVVGAVVAMGVLVLLGGLGKSLFSSEAEAAEWSGEPLVSTALVAESVVEKAVGTSETIEEPRRIEREVQAEEPAPKEPEKPTEKVDNPRAEALALLNRGKMKEAIPMAQAAIEKEPDQALGYLYLGSALQDLGKRAEAISAYSDCVRHATIGPVGECRAMGGRP
jgi:tetratricopeptide (TPR) repeat protein